ncbi:MAG: deoxynucleoside kinase, partial [Emcibacteraceae bacterium]|nr:deoxynucleoside kinase [Emcibacteraceae bacterium]
EAINQCLGSLAHTPNLIIYLDASDEVLLERIKKRNRSYENNINEEYLGSLREAYSRDLLTNEDVEIMQVDVTELKLDPKDEVLNLFSNIEAFLRGV